MTLGRSTSGAIKIKTDGGLRAVECACCGCESDAIFQSLTASLSHHGFAPFSCDSGSNPDTSTRYLTLTYSGLGSTGCGEYKKHGEATRSYTIDPMTGYQCIDGDPSPSFWCASSATPQCTPTSKKWDCGTISNSQNALNCDKGEDEDGNPLRLTLEENLSDAYTLDDVESNVDALLSQNPIDDNSMPPGVAGTVVAGSGHSIITWGGTAATSAYFYKENGQVMKTKLRVTFPTATSYKLITKDESGGVLSEITREATAGQVITVPPPSSPGYTTVEPSCAFPSIPTTLDCNVSGGTTTSRLVCRDDSTEEIPCPSCAYFIGPDCKEYNTKTTIVTSSGTSSSEYNLTWTFPSGDTSEVLNELNSNYSQNSTTIEKRCPSDYSCSGSLSGQVEGTTTVDGIQLEPESCTISGDGCGGVEYGDGQCGQHYGGCGMPTCNEDRSNSDSDYSENESGEVKCSFTWSSTDERLSNISFSGATVNGSVSESKSSTLYQACEEYMGGDLVGSDTKEDISDFTSQCTINVVYSNATDGAAEESDGPTQGWETETTPWCSEAQSEGCNTYSGCVGKYSGPTYRTESSASISCQATFFAPESEDAKYFETWFHYYTVEDSGPEGIESNLGATGCRVRTVRAFNTRVGTSSGGGQVSVSGPSISLSTSEGKTKCLIGPTAYTYALPADNSPE